MGELTAMAALAEVRSAVAADHSGGLLETLRTAEGEGMAAVTAVLASALVEVGEALGLGALRRIACASAARTCLVDLRRTAVITLFVEPPGATSKIEKTLDARGGN